MWTESTKNPLKPRNSPSAKVEALLRNIRDKHTSFGSGAQPAKAVIFSQWTKMLDLVGDAFRANGLKFQRIDGQLSLHQRKAALESFGNDLECNIMLASIGAAGEGIDLTAANSVHIMEPHWNPMAEAQAIDRVHRFGQLREVEVVRYIVNESIEHYVQEIQRQKLRVIKNTLSPSEERSEKINTERWKILCQYLD
ncbi:hypothetical protein N7510_011580 [Penicillium lagena]|uniref:uncharacterized protein n=1 Tax=Penicillium lagena TaxID=94218 RepID=UPI002541B479|nr:uncharacterized protein N7510_011580 [Penicillium lagena]KAJ5602046.1 hypothetical protein N7510_011580 [Penicillium lagena]